MSGRWDARVLIQFSMLEVHLSWRRLIKNPHCSPEHVGTGFKMTCAGSLRRRAIEATVVDQLWSTSSNLHRATQHLSKASIAALHPKKVYGWGWRLAEAGMGSENFDELGGLSHVVTIIGAFPVYSRLVMPMTISRKIWQILAWILKVKAMHDLIVHIYIYIYMTICI